MILTALILIGWTKGAIVACRCQSVAQSLFKAPPIAANSATDGGRGLLPPSVSAPNPVLAHSPIELHTETRRLKETGWVPGDLDDLQLQEGRVAWGHA